MVMTAYYETCTVEGCGRPHKALGCCKGHYKRLRTHGHVDAARPLREPRNETLLEYFEARIKKTDSCWLWTGTQNGTPYRKPYGLVGHKDAICQLAHRVSWKLFRGDIPEGANVLHDCPGGDNTLCVNPAHLWLGSHTDNFKDMMNKDRHCKGEQYKSAKLNDALVRTMRARHAAGESACAIANEVAPTIGANISVVRWAISGRTWKHVKQP